MPELPELQALVERLTTEVSGTRIAAPPTVHFAVLKAAAPPLADASGRTLRGLARRSKYVLIDLDDATTIAIHLMTAGRLGLHEADERRLKTEVLHVALDDGRSLRVTEGGTRKGVRVGRYDAPGLAALLGGLGPEPLDPSFTPDVLDAILNAAGRQLNALLRDGRAIAGIGRAFADEILHEAKLSPFAISTRLPAEERGRLYTAIGTVLERATDHCRTVQGAKLPAKNDARLLRIHRHDGEPCPRCGTPLAFVDFEANRIVYCAPCQTKGKQLADRRMSKLLR